MSGRPMIKAFLLIFEPVHSWEVVARSQRGLAFVFATFLMPMVLLTAVAEGWGLVHWGKIRTHAEVESLRKFTSPEAAVYEVVQALLYIFVVLIAARILKSLGETFHEIGRAN